MGKTTYFHLPILALLATDFVLQGIIATKCPDEWLNIGSKCFLIRPEKLAWEAAEFECQQVGGHLTSLNTGKQMRLLATHILRTPSVDNAWIGLSDERKKGIWENSDLSPVAFYAWAKGEPNNKGGREYCVEITRQNEFKQWNDSDCDIEKSYVCSASPK